MNTRYKIYPVVLIATLGLFAAQGAAAEDKPAAPATPATTGLPMGGMGPGMMGMGPGMMGGMGPGMMGMGPGMMGGMGPGMTGMGPGMMGGMGQGMMGMGPGMTGMGPGMMGMRAMMMLDLTAEQRDKLGKIMESVHKLHWDLMGKMADEARKLRALYAATPLDPKAIGAAFERLSAVKRQMIESMADTSNRTMELLTDEQRRQIRGQGN